MEKPKILVDLCMALLNRTLHDVVGQHDSNIMDNLIMSFQMAGF